MMITGHLEHIGRCRRIQHGSGPRDVPNTFQLCDLFLEEFFGENEARVPDEVSVLRENSPSSHVKLLGSMFRDDGFVNHDESFSNAQLRAFKETGFDGWPDADGTSDEPSGDSSSFPE